MPDLSIIIVTWNAALLIEECLQHVFASRVSFDYEVIVFDNASSDATIDVVARHTDKVLLIPSATNYGFGVGNNRAVEKAVGRYVLFLNPDAFLRETDSLQRLYDVIAGEKDVVAVGPRLLNADLTHQVGDAGFEPSLRNVGMHMFLINHILGGLPALYIAGNAFLSRQRVVVDWISGACLLVRRDVFVSVGGFSDRIFMYGEDVELGLQLRAHGKLVYLPPVHVMHLKGGTQRSDVDVDDIYVSTKWIAHLVGYQKGKVRSTILVILLVLGFFTRMVAYWTLALLTGRPKYRVIALAMYKYMVFSYIMIFNRSTSI